MRAGAWSPVLPRLLLHHAQSLLAHALGALDLVQRTEELVRLLARHSSRPARRRRRGRRRPDLLRRIGRRAAAGPGARIRVRRGGRGLRRLWLLLRLRRRWFLRRPLLLPLPSQQHPVVPAPRVVRGGAVAG